MRPRATHDVTVHGEVVVDHGETNNPLTETRPVLETEGFVNVPDMQTLVRGPTGEQVTEKPEVFLPMHGTDPDTGDLVETHERTETGMDVTLDGGPLADDEAQPFRVDKLTVLRRRAEIPEYVKLTVETHS